MKRYILQFCDQSHYERHKRGEIETLVLFSTEPVPKAVAEKDARDLRAKGKFVEIKEA